jgi:hypothetical protein
MPKPTYHIWYVDGSGVGLPVMFSLKWEPGIPERIPVSVSLEKIKVEATAGVAVAHVAPGLGALARAIQL